MVALLSRVQVRLDFDQAIDLGTLGLGVTQQIAGPLVINAGIGLNIDPASEFYGDVIDSNIELRWQRRSYDFGFYFNPYQGIGGFRFRLNDFNFTGTGVPFHPLQPFERARQPSLLISFSKNLWLRHQDHRHRSNDFR